MWYTEHSVVLVNYATLIIVNIPLFFPYPRNEYVNRAHMPYGKGTQWVLCSDAEGWSKRKAKKWKERGKAKKKTMRYNVATHSLAWGGCILSEAAGEKKIIMTSNWEGKKYVENTTTFASCCHSLFNYEFFCSPNEKEVIIIASYQRHKPISSIGCYAKLMWMWIENAENLFDNEVRQPLCNRGRWHW